MIDAGDKRFPGAAQRHVADGADPFEFGDDEIALGVHVVVGRVGELEGELGEGEAGVPRSAPTQSAGAPIGGRSAFSQNSGVFKGSSFRSRLSAQKRT